MDNGDNLITILVLPVKERMTRKREIFIFWVRKLKDFRLSNKNVFVAQGKMHVLLWVHTYVNKLKSTHERELRVVWHEKMIWTKANASFSI